MRPVNLWLRIGTTFQFFSPTGYVDPTVDHGIITINLPRFDIYLKRIKWIVEILVTGIYSVLGSALAISPEASDRHEKAAAWYLAVGSACFSRSEKPSCWWPEVE